VQQHGHVVAVQHQLRLELQRPEDRRRRGASGAARAAARGAAPADASLKLMCRTGNCPDLSAAGADPGAAARGAGTRRGIGARLIPREPCSSISRFGARCSRAGRGGIAQVSVGSGGEYAVILGSPVSGTSHRRSPAVHLLAISGFARQRIALSAFRDHKISKPRLREAWVPRRLERQSRSSRLPFGINSVGVLVTCSLPTLCRATLMRRGLPSRPSSTATRSK
jgi:hypothetical protein